jgi:tetratricopeptide (TPR) repeat protein
MAMNDSTSAADATTRRLDTAALETLDANAKTIAVAAPVPGALNLERTGDWIGRYKLIEELGEGGFGVVWRAEQVEPIHREVALKVIRPGMDSRDIIARFAAERQALALMDHPNIAAVLDAGATETGRPYFVMELVKGVPITTYCDEHKFTIRQRLELFIPVCQAVQHAHQKAILHRDLKPSNILVTEVDGKPVPKVIDFGIAKALGTSGEAALQASVMHTQAGMIIGTLQYMSPEQAGSRPDVDTRSDIYTLGVILHELLTGDTPITSAQLKVAALDEVLRLIREGEAKRPSSRLLPVTAAGTKRATARHSEPRKLSASMRGELDWIVLKTLEKERDRRYETATALAEDIRHYLAYEPVSAGPPTAGYRLRKLMRKHRAAFAFAASIVVTLAAGIVVSTWQAARATRAEADTRVALAASEANFAKAREAVDKYLTQVTADPRLNEADFHDLRKQLLESAVPFYEQLVAQKSADPELRHEQALMLGKLASVYHSIGDLAGAKTAMERKIAVAEKLVADVPTEPQYQNLLVGSFNNLGLLFKTAGQGEEAESAIRRALEIGERLISNHPTVAVYQRDLASSYSSLGNGLRERGQALAAAKAYKRALEIREDLSAKFKSTRGSREELARLYHNLGGLFEEHGDGHAEATYQRAIEIEQKLAADFPTDPEYQHMLASTQNSLGIVLEMQGKAEAETVYREALATRQNLVKNFPTVPGYRRDLADSHHNLANLLSAHGQGGAAEQAYRSALALREQLAAEFPAAPDYRQALGRSHHALGVLLRDRDQRVEAEAAYRQALKIREQLKGEFPKVPEYRDEVSGSLYSLGILLSDYNQGEEALALYQRAVELREQLVDEFPKIPAYRNSLASVHNNLGNLWHKRKQDEAAAAAYQRGLEIKEQLVADFPLVAAYQKGLASSCTNLGLFLLDRGDSEEAERKCRRAVEIVEKLTASFPQQPGYQSLLGACLHNLAKPLRQRQQWQAARQLCERAVMAQGKAIASEPKNPGYRQFQRNHLMALSEVCLSMGDHAATLAHALELPKLYPKVGMAEHQAAFYVAQCVPLAAKDPALTPPQRLQSAELYSKQAVGLLRQAIANGYKDAAELPKWEAFAPLLARPDFRALIPQK